MPTVTSSSGGNTVVAYAFTVNFIVGAGVLGLPHAFAKAGYVISSAWLVFISGVAVLTIYFTVEVIARGEAWYRASHPGNTALLNLSATKTRPIAQRRIGDDEYGHVVGNVPSMEITNLQLEINELCALFLGSWAGRAYEISITLYVYGSLWLYAVIFASTLSSAIPVYGLTSSLECDVQDSAVILSDNCRNSYRIWIAVYALISLIFTSRDLSSQKVAQVILTCLALFGIFTMVGTTLGLINMPPPDAPVHDAQTVNWGGFAFLCTAAMFSQNCHYGIPSLVQLMGDKSNQRRMFAAATATTCVVYCLLSVVCSYYWGSSTESLVTLNYKHYRANKTDSTAPWWVYAIEYFIICFPAILVTTAFPLNAIALANNMQGFFSSQMQDRLGPRKLKFIVRALASIPPLIAAFIEPNASDIITATGMFAFILTFWAPCVLFIVSKRKCVARWGIDVEQTPYSWHFSHNFYAYAVMVLTFAAFIFTIINLIHPIGS